jgi:hypothetical protein
MGNCSSTGSVNVASPDSPTAPARLLASLSGSGAGPGVGVGPGGSGGGLAARLAADEAVDAAGRVLAAFADAFDETLLRVMRRVRSEDADRCVWDLYIAYIYFPHSR